MRKLRVLAIHGFPTVLAGIEVALKEGCSSWVAATGDVGLELARKKEPNVVVLGLSFQRGNQGLDILRRLKGELSLPPQVVIYSANIIPTVVGEASVLGAFDFISLGDSLEIVVEAVRRAGAGLGPRDDSPMVTLRSVFALDGRLDFPGGYLSPREHQALKHVAFGLSNLEIGKQLGISRETVKEHVRAVIRKLEVRDRTGATAWAWANGVVSGELGLARF